MTHLQISTRLSLGFGVILSIARTDIEAAMGRPSPCVTST
jgi:hypothetical protein